MSKCKYPNCDYPCMNLPDCQEQKPVKWADYEPDGVHHNKQEQGEPVAYIHRNEYNEYRLEPHDDFDIKSIPFNVDVPLFKSPQQRTWVGLDPEEIRKTNHHMVDGAYHYSFKQGAEWAEAKLKEKNT